MNKSTMMVTSVQIPLRRIHLEQAVNRPIFKSFYSFKKMSTIFLKNVLFLDPIGPKVSEITLNSAPLCSAYISLVIDHTMSGPFCLHQLPLRASSFCVQ